MSEHDPSDIEGQEAAQESAQTEKERAALQEREDFIWLMESQSGRRIVLDLLKRAGVWRSSFSESALSMAFGEGRRNEGLYLLEKIQAAGMANYELMLKEGKKE